MNKKSYSKDKVQPNTNSTKPMDIFFCFSAKFTLDRHVPAGAPQPTRPLPWEGVEVKKMLMKHQLLKQLTGRVMKNKCWQSECSPSHTDAAGHRQQESSSLTAPRLSSGCTAFRSTKQSSSKTTL